MALAIRKHWIASGLAPRPVQLEQLPLKLQGRLPADYLSFLRIAGLPDDCDDTLIRFWPPDEWAEADPGLLCFADFLLDAHQYALWLDGPDEGKVSILYGIDGDPQPPLGDFTTFLAAYLADDSLLY